MKCCRWKHILEIMTHPIGKAIRSVEHAGTRIRVALARTSECTLVQPDVTLTSSTVPRLHVDRRSPVYISAHRL